MYSYKRTHILYDYNIQGY